MSGEEFCGVMSVASREVKKERYEKEIAFRKKSILTKQAEMIEHKSILLDYEYLLQQLEAEEQVEQDDLQTKARLN